VAPSARGLAREVKDFGRKTYRDFFPAGRILAGCAILVTG